MACEFNFTHYRAMLERALELGYEVTSFRDYRKESERALILRHDVDWTIDGVTEFSEIEHDLGVTATYFVRVHAKEYNPFGYREYKTFRDVMNLGHELGLHFESMYFQEIFKEDFTKVLMREKTVLEDIYEIDIVSASAHGYLGHSLKYDEITIESSTGLEHYTYSPEFITDMHYLSDSNGKWYEDKCLCEYLSEHKKVHVLIHPDWWTDHHVLLKG